MAKHKPIYSFIRRGDALVPEMEYDRGALEGIAQGQRVNPDIKQWRNLDRLRAYWATLQECVDATGCASSKESLDIYVRIKCKHIAAIDFVNGQTTIQPAPINTTECSEPHMIAFFEAVNECLASDFAFISEKKAA